MELLASSSGINISDVIEVIETESKMEMGRREEPYIKIVEQPASKALRFRYECEGRSAGSIPGVNSTPENKTYPTIQIVGHTGRVVVVVSCVTKGPDFRPHPHNLVGREGCKKGVCTVEVNNDTMTQSFDHLGIQCVKKKDIEEALKAREEIRVDPFRTGFSHRTQPGSIDLNAVRLTFQAFLMDGLNNKFALKPVVSDVIYDKKALCDLAICKLSHCAAPVAGGMEMILLCEKVAKEDISVRFFEERNGELMWEAFGDFSPTQVHKQVAITFKTPKYKTLQIETPVQVFIQLQRSSDKERSDPLPFQFTPLDSGCSVSGERIRKKPKILHKEAGNVLLQEKDPMYVATGSQLPPGMVKREPADTSPNPYSTYPMDCVNYQIDLTHPTIATYPEVHGAMGYPPTGTTLRSPLAPALSPQMNHGAAAVGRVSPQGPVYTVLSPVYSHTPNGMMEQHPVQNMHNIDTPQHQLTNQPMPQLNSREISEIIHLGQLSTSFSMNVSLNCESNQNNLSRAAPSQENMTDSLTRLVNTEYVKFQE